MTEESALLGQAAAGQTEAFRRLFHAHHGPVFRVAYRLTSSIDVAEDIAQECLLRIVGNPGRFDPARGSLRQYLLGMVRNLVRQRYEFSDREVSWNEQGNDDIPSCEVLPVQAVLAEELVAAVQTAVAALPLLQREAIVLFEFEELSIEEIAAVLAVNVGAVKSRLHRGRERLKRALAVYWHAYTPARKGEADETSR